MGEITLSDYSLGNSVAKRHLLMKNTLVICEYLFIMQSTLYKQNPSVAGYIEYSRQADHHLIKGDNYCCNVLTTLQVISL